MHCGKTAAAQLEKLNERALRSIFNKESTYVILLETANVPTLHHNRRVQYMGILIYKGIHNNNNNNNNNNNDNNNNNNNNNNDLTSLLKIQ